MTVALQPTNQPTSTRLEAYATAPFNIERVTTFDYSLNSNTNEADLHIINGELKTSSTIVARARLCVCVCVCVCERESERISEILTMARREERASKKDGNATAAFGSQTKRPINSANRAISENY